MAYSTKSFFMLLTEIYETYLQIAILREKMIEIVDEISELDAYLDFLYIMLEASQ